MKREMLNKMSPFFTASPTFPIVFFIPLINPLIKSSPHLSALDGSDFIKFIAVMLTGFNSLHGINLIG